jgi:hypothetical protein
MADTDELEADLPTPARIPWSLLLRGVAMVSVMLSLMVSLHWWLGHRLITEAGLPVAVSSALWTALWVAFGSIFLGFIGSRTLPRSLARVTQWVGFGWMGAFGLLVASTAASEVVLFIAGRVHGSTPAEWLTLRSVVVAALVVPAMLWGAYVAPRPLVTRLTVDIPGLAPGFDGFKVVQLSDVHIGETLDARFAALITRQVNALSADLVAITGDLVDGSVARLAHEVAPLAGLQSRFGTFYVTGNHEYYHGAEAWTGHMAQLGMTVLHNSHRVLERDGARLVVGGVPDVEGARFSTEHTPSAAHAFAGAPEGVPRLLLAHQPRFAKQATDARVDLMLSGHTHGGQIFPFNFFVKLQQPVVGGFATLFGVPTYTSLGTGYWGPPFRVGPRGEITELTLRAVPRRAG